MVRTDNEKLVRELGELGVLETEPVKHKSQSDIMITNSNGESCRVITENVADEDLPILIQMEQLKTLKSIKSMLKFFTVLTVIGLIAFTFLFLYFLGEGVR